jgi:hypothetical protein
VDRKPANENNLMRCVRLSQIKRTYRCRAKGSSGEYLNVRYSAVKQEPGQQARKTSFLQSMPFYTKPRTFAKTGSGQTSDPMS